MSDRTAAFIQRPRSIQRHRGPRTHERHLTGMVPHSRREEGVEKFIQNIRTRACSFPSTPLSLGFVPLSQSPGDSSSQSLAPRRHGAQLNPRCSTLGEVSDSSPTRTRIRPFSDASLMGFLVSFLRRPVRGGGRSCAESLDQVKVCIPPLVPPPPRARIEAPRLPLFVLIDAPPIRRAFV